MQCPSCNTSLKKAASFASIAARHFRASALPVGMQIQHRLGSVASAGQASNRSHRLLDLVQPHRSLRAPRLNAAPPWPSHRHTSSIGLTRLDKTEGEALVAGMTGRQVAAA
jgi:hypothetical protein